MYIFKKGDQVIVQNGEAFFSSPDWAWDSFVNRQNLHQQVLADLSGLKSDEALSAELGTIGAPINGQEIWASGVTYLKSREARQEEAKSAGGGDFYLRVYEAERPELFFKSQPYRAVGHGQGVRIRKDSKWNVPEPELILFACSAGSIEGYTIGNDMSSRDIEGENPLYLPQAKSYDGAAAIGPCLYVPETPISLDSLISLVIIRKDAQVFSGEISIDRMKRTHKELISYLFREMSFPFGVYLMTGTGIVPPDHFTLQYDDIIKISITNIGTLINQVVE